MMETIGQQLKQARESKNLSLKQVVEELHIREHYLLALEEDRIDQILSPVQAKGFMRLYADFLGISPVSTVPEVEAVHEKPSSPVSPESSTEEEAADTDDEAVIPEKTDETVQPESQRLFGGRFTQARSEKDLSFDAVEEELHIGKDYLQAIETETFEVLPQGIQARGLIQRYAEFLELNTNEVMDSYADLLLAKQAADQPQTKMRKPAKKVDGVRQVFTPDLIIGLGLLAVIFVIAFFSVRKMISTRSVLATDDTSAEAVLITSSATAELSATPTVELQGTSVPGEIATATLQLRPTNETGGDTTSRVILQVISNQRAYLQIITDGETAFEGRTKPGNVYEFYANDRIEMLTGNAAALDLSVIQDGQETRLGTLGLVGQVVSLTFQPDVIITPTVTPSMTPTITNTPQATETPTVTPSETPTEEE